MINSINIHQTYNNENSKLTHGLQFSICMKIQMHISISFRFKMFYKDLVCDTCF